MFGVNWSDSQTLWLNIINLSLGLVTLVCVAAIGYGVFQDLRERARKRSLSRSLDSEVGSLVKGFDGHMFEMPGLGLTMADGGEPVNKPATAPQKTARRPRQTGK